MKKIKIGMLTEGALMIALATILSLIKVFQLPYGGAITAFSMLPLVLIAFRRGVKFGIFCGVTYGVLNLMLNTGDLKGISLFQLCASVLLDYVLAFGVLGLAGIFKNKAKTSNYKGKINTQVFYVAVGTAVACTARFLCHFISGVLVWSAFAPAGTTALVYSFTYNISYMLPETVITIIGVSIICSILDFREEHIKAYPKKENK